MNLTIDFMDRRNTYSHSPHQSWRILWCRLATTRALKTSQFWRANWRSKLCVSKGRAQRPSITYLQKHITFSVLINSILQCTARGRQVRIRVARTCRHDELAKLSSSFDSWYASISDVWIKCLTSAGRARRKYIWWSTSSTIHAGELFSGLYIHYWCPR